MKVFPSTLALLTLCVFSSQVEAGRGRQTRNANANRGAQGAPRGRLSVPSNRMPVQRIPTATLRRSESIAQRSATVSTHQALPSTKAAETTMAVTGPKVSRAVSRANQSQSSSARPLKQSALTQFHRHALPKFARFSIKQKLKSMNATLAEPATPEMETIPTKPGAKLKELRAAVYENGQDTPAAYKVEGIDKSGKFDAVLLFPTSAHDGLELAKKWAKESTYEVKLIQPDGSSQMLGRVPSTGMVTQQGVSLRLKPGVSRLQMWPMGSGGVSGFRAGREIELHWNLAIAQKGE